jgi:hypothetical protein
MVKHPVLLAAMVASVAGSAFAQHLPKQHQQELVPCAPMQPGIVWCNDITPGHNNGGGGAGGSGGYGTRDVLQPVYKTNDTTPAALGAGACYILEDVNFCPGGWCTYASPRQINTLIWHLQCTGWTGTAPFPQTGTPTAEFDTVFEFYNAPQGGFTATPMVTQPPAAVLVVDTVLGSGFGWTTGVNLGTPITITGSSCFIGIRYIQHGTYGTGLNGKGIRLFDGTVAGAPDQGANPAGQAAATQLVNPRFDGALPNQVGASTIDYGRDYDLNQIWEGDPTDLGAPHNHRSLATVQSLELDGIGPTVQPTPNITRCGPDLADGTTVIADTVATSAVRWIRVCITNAANDAALTFLDVDTETSATPVAIGMYDSSGNLLDADNVANGSPGLASQISFGVGRRAEFAAGQSKQYDGRSGQLAASTGTGNGYFIAVAPAGSNFGPQFNVSASANAGGAYNLRLSTNENGAALAPSVPPQINGTDYGTIDPTQTGAFQGTGVLVGLDPYNNLGGVVWSKFVLSNPATSASHAFVDMNFGRLSPNVTEKAYIFDSNGNILYTDSGSGPAPGCSQFSLGAPHDATYTTDDPSNTSHFQGNTPAGNTGLAAGTYYVCSGFTGTQDLSALPTGHRWHVRGTNGSNLDVGFDMYTGLGVNNCCRNDFNGDGAVGTDADIEAFFACLSGNCCPTCPPNADFNCDGGVGTDADIESFFRVLSGGPC